LKNKNTKSKSSVKSSVRILSLMTANKFITILELAGKLGLTTRTIEKLQSENKLESTGSDMGGYWEVLKK
jgi:ATP-dependent DNA helicase RecG